MTESECSLSVACFPPNNTINSNANKIKNTLALSLRRWRIGGELHDFESDKVHVRFRAKQLPKVGKPPQIRPLRQ